MSDTDYDEDVREHAEQIYSQFPDDVDVTEDEVATLVNRFYDYGVRGDETNRAVIEQLADNNEGVEQEDLRGNSGGQRVVTIDEIDTDGEFVTLEAKVAELWDSNSDSVSQVGLLEDNNGRIKFISWETSEVPLLIEGESYRLDGVATNDEEQQNRFSVSLNSETDVEMLDDVEFEAPDNDTTVTGVLVDMQNGSGLIERCNVEDCSRVLYNNECSEHGDVDGEFDLRIKAVLDTGETTHTVVFGREMTESLTEMTLEESKNMAQDALDTSVVAEEMTDRLMLSTFEVTGYQGDENVIAQEVTELTNGPLQGEVEELLMQASSLTDGDQEEI